MERKVFLVGATVGLLTIAQLSSTDGHKKLTKRPNKDKGGQNGKKQPGLGNRMMSNITNMLTNTIGTSWIGLLWLMPMIRS